MAHALDLEPDRLTLYLPDPIEDEAMSRFGGLITRRAAREPVSHITGRRSFYGRTFRVTADVLDPRPETEILVEAALASPFETVLDLGTGSGCILVTLLAETTTATGLGVDLSELACLQASANAVLHRVADRARILQSDWFDAVEGRFDLIVANPPYLAKAEMAGIAPELALYEPAMALTDGADGLSAYRVIADTAQGYLTPRGRVLAEIGWQQGPAVQALFDRCGWADTRILADLDGRDRVICARNPA